ncbi:MAG: type II toxin-antitoxin system Phd/YefM family antitoxin [Armatimonadetes bacterium]|nr:type II toxin-antitoxin system Phd/YefM family antitoxin [Armatimonadota bacterium]
MRLMESIGISEFKSKCIALLKELQSTRTSLIVTHRGRPLARIEPILNEEEPRRLGALRHLGRIRGDLVMIDFPDEWEMETK